MKGIQIISTGRALPRRGMTNDDLSRLVETNDEWITTRTGIKNRYKCEDGESCASLAVSAARRAVEKGGIDVRDIGAVIVATSTPDTIFPTVAATIQKELQLPEEVMAFDISVACTGFLYGLKLAHGLLQTMNRKYVLVVGSEQLSRILDYRDRSTCILFGDGAGAAIIGASDAQYVQKIWTRCDHDALNCQGVGGEDCFVHMRGNDVFKFAVTALEQALEEVLEEANCTLEDVDYVVCHQANLRIIQHVSKKYPTYADKFYINIDRYGNTSSASIPIAIDELTEANTDRTGMKLLCIGFGAGLTWSGAIVEVNRK